MIRYAEEKETAIIKEIFDVCFPKDEDFSRWFFESQYNFKNTIVFEINGKIVANLQMLDYKLCLDNEYKGSYIFAAGTLPQYRGKKIMEQLIEFSFKECQRKNIDFSFLIVEEPSLLNYYNRFGFENYFTVGEHRGECKNQKLDVQNMSPKHFEEVNKIYLDNMKNKLYLKRNKDFYQILLDMYGKNAKVLIENGQVTAYSFGENREEYYYGAETFGEKSLLLISQIGFDNNKKTFLSRNTGEKITIGMIKPIHSQIPKNMGYINLLFN